MSTIGFAGPVFGRQSIPAHMPVQGDLRRIAVRTLQQRRVPIEGIGIVFTHDQDKLVMKIGGLPNLGHAQAIADAIGDERGYDSRTRRYKGFEVLIEASAEPLS